MDVIRTPIYERKASRLLNESEIEGIEDEIVDDPEKWPIIKGTGGIRKARGARGNSGKSGGVRVIYYFWLNKKAVCFVDIYAKNEKENISDADKKILRKIITELTKGE